MPDNRDGSIAVREPRSEAEWQALFDLRWRVLRAPWNQPRGSERDELEAVATHRVAIDDRGRLIGVGRLHPVDPGTGQIRYMAVEPGHERRGVGTGILTALEAAARAENLQTIRLHARESAVVFYLQHGYRSLGPSHVLFGAIHHQLMEKCL